MYFFLQRVFNREWHDEQSNDLNTRLSPSIHVWGIVWIQVTRFPKVN